MTLIKQVVLAFLCAGAPARLAAQAASPSSPVPPDFDAFVQRAITQLNTPGIAVAVVMDGRTVFAKGYGVRRLGDPAPVDANTVFQVASNTKATTAAILAMLVDEGKLKWDDRVEDHLPWFRMSDPYISHEMRVHDLLSHVSGLSLGMGDLLWMYSTLDRRAIAEGVGRLPIANSFRSNYAYDNVLYVVATELIEAVEGKSWDDVIRDRILHPLGMTSASTTVRGWDPRGNYAAPHEMLGGRLQVVNRDTVDNIGGTGALNASVADMAKWVRVQLDSGRIDATHRLWTADQTRQMWLGRISQTSGRGAVTDVTAGFAEYALGWNTYDYLGNKVVTHTGGLSGQITRVFLLPAKHAGFVVLTNAGSSAMTAVTLQLRDWLTGHQNSGTDYITQLAAPEAQFDYAAYDRHLDSTRVAGSGPSLPLAGYAATWTDPWYGDITTTLEQGKLAIRFAHTPGFTGDLEHWSRDVFRIHFRVSQMPDAFIWFALDQDGKATTARMAPVYPNTDFSYDWQDLALTRKP